MFSNASLVPSSQFYVVSFHSFVDIKDMIPTKIAEHFNFTLPALSPTHIEGRRFDNGKETRKE